MSEHNPKLKRSSTYESWNDIIKRCTNPNHKRYKDWGGRGIKVCERWLKFEHFLEDMGECPNGLTIDRINNDGNYCKENCRWATRKKQCRNKRNNRLIKFNGETKCLIEWAEKFNINWHTLYSRLSRNWSIEKALKTPIQKREKRRI